MNSPVNAPVTTESAAVAYAAALDVIRAAEPDVAAAIAGELASQRRQLKLIASENYASPAVLLAMGNWLSDKYAEGTIGRRLYAGCETRSPPRHASYGRWYCWPGTPLTPGLLTTGSSARSPTTWAPP